MFKKCPFCNGTEIHFQQRTITGTNTELDGLIFHYVRCFDCDAQSGEFTDSDAREAYGYTGETPARDLAFALWNMRKGK